MLNRHFSPLDPVSSVVGVRDILGRHQRVAWAGAGGLVAAMGVGRFAFTPLLPLMESADAVTPSGGAVVATANYAGYLVGAAALAVRPRINTSMHLRFWAGVLIASEAAMAVASGIAAFSALRLLAGVASAVIFVGCISTVTAARRHGASTAVTFAGVGIGIALSGAIIALVGSSLDWRSLWLVAAALTALFLVPVLATRIEPESAAPATAPDAAGRPSHRPAWRFLLASYFLEGVGYIVIGTFLVAAVGAGSRTSVVGPLVWLVVGIAAAPSVAIWARAAARFGAQRVLVVTLLVQTVGAVLPAVSSSAAVAVVAAALFGMTFLGVVAVTMSVGAALPVARTAAVLTAVYGVGQMLGPLVVAPVIGSSYDVAFSVAAVVLLLAAAAAVGVARTMPSTAAPDLPSTAAPDRPAVDSPTSAFVAQGIEQPSPKG
ncbi:YbfB/YjiJ family MFS transporter [Williamsia deligens]